MFPVGKRVKAGACTGCIIPIKEDLLQDPYKYSVKAADTIMVNAPTIGMIMVRMSNSVMVTLRMRVTCLLRTSKELCQCLQQ